MHHPATFDAALERELTQNTSPFRIGTTCLDYFLLDYFLLDKIPEPC
jgi:hypothetical protein